MRLILGLISITEASHHLILTVVEHHSEWIDLVDTFIHCASVNEVPSSDGRGVNSGMGMGLWLLHVPRVRVIGHT